MPLTIKVDGVSANDKIKLYYKNDLYTSETVLKEDGTKQLDPYGKPLVNKIPQGRSEHIVGSLVSTFGIGVIIGIIGLGIYESKSSTRNKTK